MIKQIPRPKSLTEIAVEHIRKAITKGDLGLGQPVSESALAASLGISKTPVREALAQLKIERLVKIFPQKGTFVFTMSEQEVINICELRYTVEGAALKLAIKRNQQAFLNELRKVVTMMGVARPLKNLLWPLGRKGNGFISGGRKRQCEWMRKLLYQERRWMFSHYPCKKGGECLIIIFP